MKFEMNFIVTMSCNHYEGDNTSSFSKETLEISLTEKDAKWFLFNFTPNVFKLKDYVVFLRFDQSQVLQSIVLREHESGDMYVVTNLNQVISQIHEGYLRSKISNKVLQIMEFDFDTYSEQNMKEDPE